MFVTYGKTILAALAALVIALQVALDDNKISQQEWVTILIAVLSAVGVYYAPAITKASRDHPPP